ncbi:hypothetical protein HN51_004963 [Arachis hypogaea]
MVRCRESFARSRGPTWEKPIREIFGSAIGKGIPYPHITVSLDSGPTINTSLDAISVHSNIPQLNVEVVRIFTDMSISPSLSPRQCPDRYAFRAGGNLPDKEFRYLRTVIVTAAVHRGFGRRLPCH